MSTGRRSTKSTSCPQESSANQNKGYTRWALKWAETHKETHLPTIDFHGRTCEFQGGEQKLTSQVVWMGETHRRVQAIWHSYHLHVQISPCSECPDPCCKKGIRHDLHESLRRKVRTGQLFEEQTEKTTKTSHEQWTKHWWIGVGYTTINGTIIMFIRMRASFQTTLWELRHLLNVGLHYQLLLYIYILSK